MRSSLTSPPEKVKHFAARLRDEPPVVRTNGHKHDEPVYEPPGREELLRVFHQAAEDVGQRSKQPTRLDEAIRRHAKDKIAGPPVLEKKKPAVPDVQKDWRRVGKVIAFLQHDSEERSAVLHKLGIKNVSPRLFAALAQSILDSEDDDQPGRMFGKQEWDELPHGDRYKLPRSAGLNTRRLGEAVERPVDWTGEQRIPRGKLTIVSGDPDLGKTWLILDIMARLTTGRPMPDGATNPFNGLLRDVLWCSAEDADEDTIKPRFRMLGGDDTRFHSVQFVLHEEQFGKYKTANVEQVLNLAKHTDWLDCWLTAHPLVVLVGLDPLAAFLGKTDSHRNSEVRALLTPVVKLADKHQVAIIGNNHLHKGEGDAKALYRGMGSIAFVAAARSSWQVTPDPKEPRDRRLFTKVKGNLASEDVGGLAFRIGKEWNGISWEEGRIETTADQALTPPEDSRAPARAEAKEWLRELLKDGPVPSDTVWEKVEADGMCEKTIRLAKKELGIKAVKTGGKGAPWEWTLPK